MTLLALTAAATMSSSDPAYDLSRDAAIGAPIADYSRSLRPRRPKSTFEDFYQPFPNEVQETLPLQEEQPYEDDFFPEPEEPVGNGDYWTFDPSGNIPLRYGVETDDGRYEYDLANDEVTLRIRN
ncbi:MAG: hypothetical protein ACO1SV_23390 [Fimbriimonas sp.]